MQKEFYQSKTFWFNVLTIGLGIIEVITKTYPVSPEILVLINGVGNLFLRMLSGQPITFGGKSLFRGKQ